MEFDVFFSISQTPDAAGECPDESTMLHNYLEQLAVADELGYGVAWLAQAHLSTEVQKRNKQPVVPHWKGEVGLCTDFFQLAMLSMERTSKIEVGSAVMSILANGGPIAVAERIGNFCSLQSVRGDSRRLHVGFSAGRFQFMASPYGIVPRDAVEEAAWPALRGQIFWEAAEIMLRLVRGDTICSDDIRPTVLTRGNFRSDEDWSSVQSAYGDDTAEIPIDRRYVFEHIKSIPQEWDRSKVNLVLGSHEPALQEFVNTFLPVQVFNLSITQPEVIDATHERMAQAYQGEWQRSMMPRTVMVFLNEEEGLTAEEQSAAAQQESKEALSAYWSALEGTLDPAKVAKASDNAVIGNAEQIAAQIRERFHPEDRLMLWFDFFKHDSARVCRDLTAFMDKVAPLVNGGTA
jgi:alkanesulfonate monooxygenase SsuD/methylene tetrahydromethanopterin reductase-like flavin-dependent oxidoreductase (luciferase family)